MSYTLIYRLGREPCCLGETRNAWRGAMHVWNHIAQRFFGLDNFPLFSADSTMSERIWNAHETHTLTSWERVALLTTLDNAVVNGRDAEKVADEMITYARHHPESSLGEQANIIRFALDEKELLPGDFIAWQQTSVGEFWGQKWNEETDDWNWYDPNKGDKHFDVLSEGERPLPAPPEQEPKP